MTDINNADMETVLDQSWYCITIQLSQLEDQFNLHDSICTTT